MKIINSDIGVLMHIVTNLLFECNLKCEYCYLQARDTRNTVLNHADIHRKAEEWFDGLEWLGKNFNPISTIDISGGEPFLYEDILKFITRIPMNVYLGLTTNATRIPDRFFLLNEERKARLHITASLHLDSLGKIPEKFKENAIRLRDSGFNFVVNYVAYEKQVDMIKEIKDWGESNDIKVNIEPYIDYSNPEKRLGFMANEIFSELNSDTKKMLTKIKKRPIPSDCYIGESYMWITPDGDVHNCMGQFFNKTKPIANIFKKEVYRRPENPQVCDIFCPCSQNW